MAPTILQKEVTSVVTFMSYNSTGINSVKCQWINDICDKSDVNYLSIQEHFKSNKTTDKFFKDNFKNFNSEEWTTSVSLVER